MKKEKFMAMTLRELEEKTETSNVVWAYHFTDKRSPTLRSLEKYSEKLEVPLGQLTEWIRERRDRTLTKRKTA